MCVCVCVCVCVANPQHARTTHTATYATVGSLPQLALLLPDPSV
jgi:hypothetical protein